MKIPLAKPATIHLAIEAQERRLFGGEGLTSADVSDARRRLAQLREQLKESMALYGGSSNDAGMGV